MISKMKPYSHADQTGSRIGIVFNGSPLFTGDAGSGESNIRKWIIENDWLEGIVALPDQLFYNTGINHLHLDRDQPQSPQAQGQGAVVNAVDLIRKCAKASATSATNCRNSRSRRSSAPTVTSSNPNIPKSSTTTTSVTARSPSSGVFSADLRKENRPSLVRGVRREFALRPDSSYLAIDRSRASSSSLDS